MGSKNKCRCFLKFARLREVPAKSTDTDAVVRSGMIQIGSISYMSDTFFNPPRFLFPLLALSYNDIATSRITFSILSRRSGGDREEQYNSMASL